MRLHTLAPRPGAKHRRKRLGIGESSGLGKTSGKGHKGQKARSGGTLPHAGFEGGQMPLYRKIPRRGFNNARFHKTYAVFNVATLEERFDAGATVNEETLREAGLLNGTRGRQWQGIKILGSGEISKSLKIEVDHCSGSAQGKIEKAGGSVALTQQSEKKETAKKAPAAEKKAAKKAAKKEAVAAEKSEDTAEQPKYEGSAPALEDGSQPEGFPIKGNEDSMKFHLPDGRYYKQTVAEVWFATEEAAKKAGFEAAGA